MCICYITWDCFCTALYSTETKQHLLKTYYKYLSHLLPSHQQGTWHLLTFPSSQFFFHCNILSLCFLYCFCVYNIMYLTFVFVVKHFVTLIFLSNKSGELVPPINCCILLLLCKCALFLLKQTKNSKVGYHYISYTTTKLFIAVHLVY